LIYAMTLLRWRNWQRTDRDQSLWRSVRNLQRNWRLLNMLNARHLHRKDWRTCLMRQFLQRLNLQSRRRKPNAAFCRNPLKEIYQHFTNLVLAILQTRKNLFSNFTDIIQALIIYLLVWELCAFLYWYINALLIERMLTLKSFSQEIYRMLCN